MFANAQMIYPEVKIEAGVTDENGNAVSNATVTVWFTRLRTNNPIDGQTGSSVLGSSDTFGVFSSVGNTLHLCGVRVEKEGFYTSRIELDLDKNKDGKWIPWHQIVNVVLRKHISPIAMYAKRLNELEIPATNSPVGFDLKQADWTPPYGNGMVRDLVFLLETSCPCPSPSTNNWKVSIKFPGEGNGWQGLPPSAENPQSDLLFPRSAYADGYQQNEMIFAYKREGSEIMKTNSTMATNYFFQVRSEFDENKKLKNAYYGKIQGPIYIQKTVKAKTAKIYFTYYLNPTSLDRNMEFDPEKNLMKRLEVMDRAIKP